MESMDNNPKEEEDDDEVESCQKGMTRKDFMKALVKKSAAAGVLLTAISAVNKFDMPSAYAATGAMT
ncbi:MAG: hypothetical protein K2W95_03885 [Candidatus Obscuribacterales bacterium]|nr:hypothetical protein [Candidatus Obscuribacterales bacterium]